MYVLGALLVSGGGAITADAFDLPSRLAPEGTVHHVLRALIVVLLIAWAVAFAFAAVVAGRRRLAVLRHHPAAQETESPGG